MNEIGSLMLKFILFFHIKDEAMNIQRKSGAVYEYSVVFNQMVDVLERNQGKSKNARQYNDAIKQFSTYIFLLCGRICYETLSKNLPMPSTKTICKNFLDFQLDCSLNIYPIFQNSALHQRKQK